MFRKRTNKHTSPFGFRSQIDYMLFRCKYRSSVQDCQAYAPFLYTDHKLLVAKVKIKLRAHRPKTKRIPRYNWSSILSEQIKDQFVVECRNQFSVLSENASDHCEQYSAFVQAVDQAAKVVIPLIPKKKKFATPWLDANVVQKREALRKSKAFLQNIRQSKSTFRKKILPSARKLVQRHSRTC